MSKHIYPLRIPKPFMVYPAIRVYDEDQYDTIVNSHNNHHSVANPPKRHKDTKKILEEEFPVYVQLAWLPWCGNHVRAYGKTVRHGNFIEYDDVPKIK